MPTPEHVLVASLYGSIMPLMFDFIVVRTGVPLWLAFAIAIAIVFVLLLFLTWVLRMDDHAPDGLIRFLSGVVLLLPFVLNILTTRSFLQHHPLGMADWSAGLMFIPAGLMVTIIGGGLILIFIGIPICAGWIVIKEMHRSQDSSINE